MSNKSEKVEQQNAILISKEQQRNIATWIIRSYNDVEEVTFLKSYKDKTTGSIGVNFKINNNEKYHTGVVVNNISEFNTSIGLVGLNPVQTFEELDVSNNSDNAPVKLDRVKINYMGE